MTPSEAEILDLTRVADIHAINASLARFASDPTTQSLFRRPMVQIALHCWAGTTTGLSEKDMATVTKDEGVVRLYPDIKHFEQLCRKANIPFAIDHIRGAESHLSSTVVEAAYGKDFVHVHPELFPTDATSTDFAPSSGSGSGSGYGYGSTSMSV